MDTKSIKEKAKSLLEGRVLSIFVFLLVTGAIASLIGGLFNAVKIPGFVTTSTVEIAGQTYVVESKSLSNLVTLLVSGPFAFATAHGMLKLARNKKATADIIGEIKNAFSGDNLTRSIVAAIRVDVFIFLWSLLFVIPGIYKAIQYSQTMRLLADNDKMTPAEAQKKSMEIMQGHTWDYIKLILSYFGWFLAIVFTFGLASIYVTPYMELAKVTFYENLKK